MNTTETETTQLITAEHAATLRAARETLRALEKAARDAGLEAMREGRRGWDVNGMDYGRMSALAENASDAIFDFLNVSKNHCKEHAVDFNTD